MLYRVNDENVVVAVHDFEQEYDGEATVINTGDRFLVEHFGDIYTGSMTEFTDCFEITEKPISDTASGGSYGAGVGSHSNVGKPGEDAEKRVIESTAREPDGYRDEPGCIGRNPAGAGSKH